MIIAVEERLSRLKEELKKRGYDVVEGEDARPIEAVVYYDDGEGQNHMGAQVLHHGFYNGAGSGKPAFLVNAYNKSSEEIDQMLQRRSYSPLFTGLE